MLVLAVTGAAVALPPGGSFIDDDGSVHEGSIEAVAAEEITEGCNPPANDRYCPDDVVTRGQMAAFLARALDLPASEDNHFADEDGHLFEDAIDSLAASRITLGCNPPANDLFCPDHPMTRGQMAAMLVRAFHFPESEEADRFVDDTGSVFEGAIDDLAAAGVTMGCDPPDNTRFCPADPITRAQMATFLTRALDLEPSTPPARPHPVVVVESRQSWGARPAETDRMIPHTVERLTIHHAGTQSGTNGPAQFRGWQNWHMSGQGWPDIAYHLIIGIDGTVYQGRDPGYRGDTGTTYDTTGHFLVVVEGNFDHEQPTSAQLDSLTRVLAWAATEYDVSPATISGHRDHAGTSCPGHNVAALVDSGELRLRVEDVIATGGVHLVWP